LIFFQIESYEVIDISEPYEVLKIFLGEMNVWERNFFERKNKLINAGQSTAECNQNYAKLLEPILEKYSIKDAKSWARLEAPRCGDPAMYDPARDKVHEPTVKGDAVFIIVDQAVGLEARFRFSLTKQDDRWKIKKKDTFRSGKLDMSTL
jgi:hypothetical protein